jgi:hypothetical protein
MPYIKENEIRLRRRNYVCNATTESHWYNVYRSRYHDYRETYGEEFCLIINCSYSYDDAYVIPISSCKSLFIPAYLHDLRRWVGNVQHGMLTVSGAGFETRYLDIMSSENAFHLLRDAPQPVPQWTESKLEYV